MFCDVIFLQIRCRKNTLVDKNKFFLKIVHFNYSLRGKYNMLQLIPDVDVLVIFIF